MFLLLQALEGLRVILGVRPQTLATMVPKLLRGTLTATNCKALGSLAEVAGPAISPHLSNIFPPLLRLASQPESSSSAAPAAKDALIKVVFYHLTLCHNSMAALIASAIDELLVLAQKAGAVWACMSTSDKHCKALKALD